MHIHYPMLSIPADFIVLRRWSVSGGMDCNSIQSERFSTISDARAHTLVRKSDTPGNKMRAESGYLGTIVKNIYFKTDFVIVVVTIRSIQATLYFGS